MKYLVRALRHPREYTWLELRPWQRHSLVLAVAGTVYLLLGVAWLCTGPSPQQEAGLRLPLKFVSFDVLAVIWIAVGLLGMVSSRWPPASKTWGYSTLTGLAACWSGIYLIGVLLFDAPALGLTAALVWALLGFLWWAIAGLVNPDDVIAQVNDALCLGSDGSEEP